MDWLALAGVVVGGVVGVSGIVGGFKIQSQQSREQREAQLRGCMIDMLTASALVGSEALTLSAAYSNRDDRAIENAVLKLDEHYATMRRLSVSLELLLDAEGRKGLLEAAEALDMRCRELVLVSRRAQGIPPAPLESEESVDDGALQALRHGAEMTAAFKNLDDARSHLKDLTLEDAPPPFGKPG